MLKRQACRGRLAIIDRTMKAISGVTDPEEARRSLLDRHR